MQKRFVIIGCQGHYGDCLGTAAQAENLTLIGIAPGFAGEDMQGIQKDCGRRGLAAPPCFASWETMAESLRPDIAVVNTRFDRNAAIAAALLRQGIHVYAEKPAGITLEQIDKVEAARDASGAVYLSMLTYYYEAPYPEAAQIVRSGALGDLCLISAQKSYRFGTRPPYFFRPEQYGGTIPWVGIHALSWAYWFSGGRPFTDLAAHRCDIDTPQGRLDIACTVEGTLGGIPFTAHMDYLRPDSAPTHGDDRLRAAGTKGILEIRDGQIRLLGIEKPNRPPPAQENIFAAFVKSIDGTPARFTAADCFAVSRAAVAAQAVARCG
jgi:predicted dehydrogenase